MNKISQKTFQST